MVELTKRAIRIFEVIKMVDIGVISVEEACEKLGKSRRTVFRYLKKIKGGIENLNYRSHNGWNRTTSEIEEKVIKLKQERPERSAPLICNLMKMRHNLKVYPSTVKRVIERSGIEFKRTVIREPIKPYEMKRFGDMWQIDTFERKCVLGISMVYIVLIIDDYSRGLLAGGGFRSDSTPNNMLLVRMAVEDYGIPHSIKTDNDTKFRVMRDKKGETDLVRACREIGCTMFAHKPYNAKSKGKIERRVSFVDQWFVKENTFTSLEDLNEKLQKFIAWFNTEFKISSTGVEPVKRMSPSSTRKIPDGLNLDDVFCEKIERKVKRDCTISYKCKKYLVGKEFIGEKTQLHIVQYKKILRVWHKEKFVKEVPF